MFFFKKSCNGGCFIGKVNCEFEPTTTAPLTTTSSQPGPCDDMNYNILTDETRNVNFGRPGQGFCDSEDSNDQSSDWNGPSWYR